MRVSGIPTQVATATTCTPAGVAVRRSWQKHLLTFLMVFGPGLIVMEADNDAGAVSTYMQAGGQYGLHLLWTLIVLLPICYFVQEMVARLGIATGKGHAAMIYERFGKWWGRFSLFDLLVVNFLTLITEFAAISLALSAHGSQPLHLRAGVGARAHADGRHRQLPSLGAHRHRALPAGPDLVCAGLHGASRLGSSGCATPWPPPCPPAASPAVLSSWSLPSWARPSHPGSSSSSRAAWPKSACASADLNWARLDTLIGAIFTVFVAGAMMLVGNYGYQHGIDVRGSGAVRRRRHANARPLRSQRHSAADGQRRGAGHNRHLAGQRLGLWRSQGLGTLPAQEAVGSARLLRNLHRLCRRGRGRSC